MSRILQKAEKNMVLYTCFYQLLFKINTDFQCICRLCGLDWCLPSHSSWPLLGFRLLGGIFYSPELPHSSQWKVVLAETREAGVWLSVSLLPSLWQWGFLTRSAVSPSISSLISELIDLRDLTEATITFPLQERRSLRLADTYTCQHPWLMP